MSKPQWPEVVLVIFQSTLLGAPSHRENVVVECGSLFHYNKSAQIKSIVCSFIIGLHHAHAHGQHRSSKDVISSSIRFSTTSTTDQRPMWWSVNLRVNWIFSGNKTNSSSLFFVGLYQSSLVGPKENRTQNVPLSRITSKVPTRCVLILSPPVCCSKPSDEI